MVWAETAAPVEAAGQSAVVEAAAVLTAALMGAAALWKATTEQDAAMV